jgi:sulfopyruvate decarboxylase TPP-binding subunit
MRASKSISGTNLSRSLRSLCVLCVSAVPLSNVLLSFHRGDAEESEQIQIKTAIFVKKFLSALETTLTAKTETQQKPLP